MKQWIDEIYLGIIIMMSAYVVFHTKGDPQVAIAVLGLNAGAIAFYKWANKNANSDTD